MGSTLEAAAMAADQDKLQAPTVADKKMCYLCSDYNKPQHDFKRVLADNSYSEFKHLKRQQTESSSDEENSDWHPYRREITDLIDNRNVEFQEFLDGCEKPSTEMGVDYVWVETEKDLIGMVEVLNKERVFAVDTEQHSSRSFLGFTSLIQISTLTLREDYLVDPIKLHDVMGLLKPVFADPGICKVFHGANNDVLWLQRDFHIYVVNLFDTKKACDVLGKEHKSLAYLLKTYCDVLKDKLLQTVDWRQRPLTKEMIRYARADAHYLLYITYCLCLELKQKQLKIGKSVPENPSPGDEFHFLLEASRLSNETCLRPFVKRTERIISSSDCDAKELVRRLCLWRDVMARLHDESTGFVLSEKAINALAAEIPKTEADICSSISKADLDVESPSMVPLPSAVVCSHLKDLVCLLQDNIASLDNSIFQMLIQRHLGPAGSCPRSAYNEALLSIGPTDIIMSDRNGSSASKQSAKKQASQELSDKNNSCKAPFYEEYEVYTRSREFLCYCDRDKLNNHLAMDYASIYFEDEKGIHSIILHYEPEGNIPENYGIQSKKNKCVGCGDGNQMSLSKYEIIPSCYKSGLSRIIVLVCGNCQRKAHAAAEKYKKEVADKFRIPLLVRLEPQNTPASSSLPVVPYKEVRDAATALQCQGKKLHPDRKKEFMKVLVTHYGRSNITDEDIKNAQLVGKNPRKRRKVEQNKCFKLVKENNIGGETSASTKNALEGEDLSNEITSPLDDSNTSMKNDKSLQGHGPHGEQVVKRLKEYEVYTRSGKFLCYCDPDTLYNHLAMDYASIFSEDEKGIHSISLHYEPEGNSENYGKQSKKNKCDGCGDGKQYMQKVHDAAEKYKKKVADKFRTPSLVHHEPQNTPASSTLPVVPYKKVRAAATALQCQGEKLPTDRFIEFMMVLVTHYGWSELTDVDLKNAELVGLNPSEVRKVERKKRIRLAKENNIGGETSASLEKNDKSLQGHGPHGEQVVKHLLETCGEDGIREFRREWRQVFVTAVRPKYLPDGWIDKC